MEYPRDSHTQSKLLASEQSQVTSSDQQTQSRTDVGLGKWNIEEPMQDLQVSPPLPRDSHYMVEPQGKSVEYMLKVYP